MKQGSLAEVACKLETAGAECVLICENTMHLVAESVASAVNIPLVNIIDATAHTLQQANRRSTPLLATRYTMEQGFYSKRMEARGLPVMIPNEADREVTHRINFEELCAGRILEESRAELTRIVEKAKAAGTDSVIFGCTELGLILDPNNLPLPALSPARAIPLFMTDENRSSRSSNDA